jgi:glucosamine-6-phosphate deaminase
MEIVVREDRDLMGRSAAQHAGKIIRNAIAEQGEATIVVATGASQFTVLANLILETEIDWSRVVGFHLDEYLQLPMTHPASFRGYLKERLVDHVPLKAFHYIDGEHLPIEQECQRLGELISSVRIDVALVGIGENGHLAFNDPPADFETTEPYIVVDLDDDCRRQQLGEGWFATLEDVPKQAVSMSIHQILKAREIICSVPDERKAVAVANSILGSITPHVPASILQTHPRTTVYLDRLAASRLPSIP